MTPDDKVCTGDTAAHKDTAFKMLTLCVYCTMEKAQIQCHNLSSK